MSKIAFKTLKLVVEDRKNELVYSNKKQTEIKKSNVISIVPFLRRNAGFGGYIA
jgi:hypothetical protein